MREIGSGTYGSVYYDEKEKEAVKKCYHEDSREIWAGNIREMDILYRCGSHPNIVTLNRVEINSGHDCDHNKLILRLKYYSSNLQKFISKFKDGRVDISTVRIIASQILMGLEYIHANKIIHRDLKPDNILINPDTLEVAICDFGMSEILMRYKRGGSRVTAPMYRAPEVFRESYYSAEIDLWAVGLIIFSMIYGEHPYKYPSIKEKQMYKEVDKLEERLGEIEGDPTKSEERKSIEDKICDLNADVVRITLREIGKIDVKKIFSGTRFGFKKLLEGLLVEDPNKRLTASQALADSFFDSIRVKYIDPVRKEFPPLPIKLRKISIEGIPERKWITKYTMKFLSENEDCDCYPIIFHGLDIFEKYLSDCKLKSHSLSNSDSKYLSEMEVFLFLYTCFYISHKFYAITEIALAFEDFFPAELLTQSNMVKAEEFEQYMISEVLNFKFFEFTLYEIAEEMINNPESSDYFKILREYLNITQKTQSYNSYRSLYREHLMQKTAMN